MFSAHCARGLFRGVQKRDLNSKSITFVVRVAPTPKLQWPCTEIVIPISQIIAGALIFLALAAFSIVSFSKLRKRRRQRQKSDAHKQSFLRNFWSRQRFSHTGYEQTPADGPDSEAQIHPLQPTAIASNGRNERQQRATTGRSGTASNGSRAGNPVDRNTSVRSVMTLPVYRATAGNNEQVLGREGDRDGVDVIVDLPNAEEEEAMRDEEMNAIYQIRTARRQQIADREELRRQRLEARQTGNRAALADVRARTRNASNSNNLDDLRREVTRIQEQRQRSVSSVSYGDLGVARHDGTRLRASSNDSERMGLLSDAASIALSTRSDRTSPGPHRRERSASSLASMDDDLRPVSESGPRANSQSSTPRLSSGDLRQRSNSELSAPIQDGEGIPPPEYLEITLDDAGGEYSSPAQAGDSPPNYSHLSHSTSSMMENTQGPPRADTGGSAHGAQQTNLSIGGGPQSLNSRISRVPAIVIDSTNDGRRDA